MQSEPHGALTGSVQSRVSKTNGFMKDHWSFKVNIKKLWMLPTVEPDIHTHRDLYFLTLTFTL